MNLKLICFCLIILFTGACAGKQAARPAEPVAVPLPVEQPQLPVVEPPVEIKEEKKKIEKTAAEKKQDEQFVMLNFENADIETVVSTIADMLKINYILAPGVSGKITIQSHNKIAVSELFSTFQTVLEFNGFTAVKEGSFYRIIPIDTAKQQAVPIQMGKQSTPPRDASFVTQEIPLEYVKAGDVANLVRNLMPKGTDIIIYEPSNMLIITALPSGIMKLLKILEAIDIPSTERDSVKTFIYHVENGEAKKLAEVLKNLYGKKSGSTTPTPAPARPAQSAPAPQRSRTAGVAAPAAPGATGATIQADILSAELEGDVLIEAYDDINALIIKASPRAYLTLLATIKRIDIQPQQVLIEVLVAEISLNDETKLGLEWLIKGNVSASNRKGERIDGTVIGGFTSGQLGYSSATTTTTTKLPDGSSTTVDTPVGFTFKPGDGFFPAAYANIFNPDKFNMIINAAASTGNVNVLASPHILALDNKEAKIEIADEVPVATSITDATAGSTSGTSTSQVQYKSAGTILTVTPHINEKKQVTLKITQEVSELGDPVQVGSGKFQGFKTRKANTHAVVQDGHTLVIGGILTERKEQSRSGIPLLSKIPILGYLFGTTTDSVRKKELILMITPHVISNHDEADALTEEYKGRVKELRKQIEKREKKMKLESEAAREAAAESAREAAEKPKKN